jgi:membrane protein DedA with SNARE-associated domain
MFAQLAEWVTALIGKLGYTGVAVLMAMESMIFPIPSELVMPFAGFLVAQGVFTFWGAVIASAIGSLIGSLIMYYVGYFGGGIFVKRYGHYVLLEEEDLVRADHWFRKHGGLAVFACRFIPVIRHVSSVPAGAARMNLLKFSFYTVLGATIWNTFLLWVGVKLGERWEQITQYTHIFDIVVVVLALLVLAHLWHKHGKHIKAHFSKRVRKVHKK